MDEDIHKIASDLEQMVAEASALPPLEAIERAVHDLWTQVVRKGEDHVVFYDHDLRPARVRYVAGHYRIAWAEENAEGKAVWVESERHFDNPREATFYAFQGRARVE
jgi:hypothetical protein